MLVLKGTMSTRTRLSFDIKINREGRRITIHISDPGNLQADNLPLSTWGSAEVLANALHQTEGGTLMSTIPDDVIPVLELGAGTGIAGLSAAAIWHTTAVLTDLPPILPGIAANVALNRTLLAEYGGRAVCGSLDWRQPAVLVTGDGEDSASEQTKAHPSRYSHSKARLILAADTIYSEEHPELLCNVVMARMEPGPESRVLLCYPLRVGYLDFIRDLWETFEAVGLECSQEGRETIDASWDEDTPYEWCVWKWRSTD